jgi:protein-L-isoaspartate O-methyltransferase
MAELITPEGQLISVDIKEDLIVAAERRFSLFGLRNVDFLCREALSYLCSSEEFSYDRILFSFFLPPVLFDQPGIPDGRLLSPLKVGGIFQFPLEIKDKIVTYKQLIRVSESRVGAYLVQTFEFDPGIGEK